MVMRTGLGQDSQRFLSAESSKPCVIGGVIFEGVPGFASHSDGDVVYHAICHALTSLTGVAIIGGIADELCHKQGITDSEVYVKRALELLGAQQITHVACSIEGKRPRFHDHLPAMRLRVAHALGLKVSQVGITAISGEGLTDCACGDGLQCLCVMTTVEG